MKHNLLLGVILSLIGALSYSIQSAVIKFNASAIPLPMIVFIQSLIPLLLISCLLMKNGTRHARELLKIKQWHLHLLRTITGLSISYLLFASLKYIPLVNGLLLANTAPLFVPFLAYFFIAQKINHQVWIPILIAITGITLVLHPDVHAFNWASLLALGSGVGIAATSLTVRQLSATNSSETITFYFFLFATIVSGMIAMKYWISLPLSLWIALSAIGILYFCSQYFLVIGLKYTSAQLVTCLLYSNIIFAAIISEWLWHEFPPALTLAGMVLTVIGGMLCIVVEHKAIKRRVLMMNQNQVNYVKES